MPIRYRIGTALTSLVLAALPPPSAGAAPCTPHAQTFVSAPPYSARALRRARRILELRLLELREERLERVRSVVIRRLPPDLLFEGDFSASLKHPSDSRVICNR